ncbi:MAG TPA: hypothetical protein VMV03_17570 [Spirochaetia bacterium]|nr:hypothetical protein [Spirochaetia bacterium]
MSTGAPEPLRLGVEAITTTHRIQEPAVRAVVRETLGKPYEPRDLLRCVRRVAASRG